MAPRPIKELPKAKAFVFAEEDSVSEASSDGEDIGIDLSKLRNIKKEEGTQTSKVEASKGEYSSYKELSNL